MSDEKHAKKTKKEKKDKNPRKKRVSLRYVLGSYSPPGFITDFFDYIRGDAFSGAVRKRVQGSTDFLKKRRKLFIGIAIAGCFLVAAFSGYRFWLSKQPQPLRISYSYATPVNDISENRGDPLKLRFQGSAAPADKAGKEVSDGITITPDIPGTWKWEDDSTLTFTPVGFWTIGERYTVQMSEEFFPDHVKVEPKCTFTIDNFSVSISNAEFYIDPEDSKIKRITATVRGNYPIDPATFEDKVTIIPQIRSNSGAVQKRAYAFTASYSTDFLTAYIVSEPIGMPADTITMDVMVSKGVRSTFGGAPSSEEDSSSVLVPGPTSYVQVLSFTHELVKTPDQRYEQVLVLHTRGEISSDELLKNVHVWELPVDRPELPGLRPVKKHYWRNTDEMVPEVLALARKVPLEALPTEREFSSVNSFRFEADTSRYIFIQLDNGARFYGDYYLKESWGDIVKVQDFPREVSILGEGNLLSLSGDKKLSMLSRGISDVRCKIGRIRPDDINHLVSQSSGNLNNFRFTNYRFNEYNVTVQYEQDMSVPVSSPRDFEYFSFDFSRYLNAIPQENLRYGLFIFEVEGKYPYASYSDKRLIMVTDLGFFVKHNTNDTKTLFVQSIRTGSPVSRATVDVFGLNGNVIFSSVTGEDGRVDIPDLSGYDKEKKPVAYVVRRGEDLSFMPYDGSDRFLDYSAFDTGGIHGATNPKKLNAFMFSDRGIYRPGDEVRLGLVIKAGDWNINLDKTPLEYSVVDPKGIEIYNRRIALSGAGFEEIKFSTHDWSPTGMYTTSVYVIRDEKYNRKEFLGSQTVKVEEFLPDTLAVSAVFDPLPREGWISPSKLKALVSVRNLFGSPAAGNEVKAQMTLYPGNHYFRQYREYTFLDPFIKDRSYQEFLGTQTTNDDGSCEFTLDVSKFERATYNLSFYTEAFEKGSGRNVSAETTVMVSPRPYLIGYKSDGDLSYINRDSERLLSFIAIDPDLKKTAVGEVTLSLTEIRYVSMLVRQPNGVYKYQSVRKPYPVSNEKVRIPADGLKYALPTGKSGEYELKVIAADGLVYNEIPFSIAGDQNIERSLTRTAELELTLDRTDYAGGDMIEVMIKAPYAGAGLITIERDKVYAHSWFTSTGSTSVQRITVPRSLEGNGYVNVMFVRAQDSREVFMSPLSYGTVPFSVSKDSRTTRITLDFPDEAKPGKDFPIRYSTSQPGKIIVYAVDEGILQFAKYKTPDPIAFFFQKRALEVRTAQIMDLILPEYSVVQLLQAMGGGDGYDELSRNLNPFKRRKHEPVAFWSGILDAGPEAKTVTYRVPDHFNGSLRVMAVAVSSQTVGATEDKALIRNTFIISPNAPMMAAPGDEFDIAVTVTNNQKGSGENATVQLKAVPSNHLKIISDSSYSLAIPEGRDKTVNLRVKAAGPVGAAQIDFVASSGTDSSELASYMSVRPAVPYRVALETGMIKRDDADIEVPRTMYEQFSTRDVSLSYLPIGLAKGLKYFLSTYPYDCSEQITSAVFPFLYTELAKDFEFTAEESRDAINRVISILQARKRTDDSIGLWTSLSKSDPLITVYCAHFLTEAKTKGYYVPPAFMDKILGALEKIAQSDVRTMYSLTNRAYAIYVLTLNEKITTKLLESLKKDIASTNKDAETGYPGLFMAGTYAMLQQEFEASVILGKIARKFKTDDSYLYLDSLSYHSLYLTMISRHFPKRMRDVSGELLEKMAEELRYQRYTSISASFALMAIDSYLGAAPTAETGDYTVEAINAEKVRTVLELAGERMFSAEFPEAARRIAINNRDRIPLFYQITQAGFDLAPPEKEIKNGIEVYREFCDEKGNKITKAAIGDTVWVKINFRSISSDIIRDVALVDLLPAGFEPDINSIRSNANEDWEPDYVDIREDRLVVFGTVTRDLHWYMYQVRAINTGIFVVPPLFAEAMYDKSVWAMRPQDPLEITKD